MEFGLILFLFVASIPAISAEDVSHGAIVVDGTTTVAQTDNNFICATIDWWPHDKCDYNQCPWHYTSAINLDLSHPFLAKAVQAFNRLRIRVGGSLQDQVLYNVGNLTSPCHPFRKMKDGLFGFSKGCLHMERWDELNHFFKASGVMLTFGLNALHGRHKIKRSLWGGDWDSTNAHDFMKYTISKGYQIDSWEFGNELSGNGIGAHVLADQYGKDLIYLKKIINELYKGSQFKPSLVAPGGFFDQEWFAKLLQISGSSILDAMSHHMYNLGAGVDPKLVSKILDPNHLSKAADTFSNLTHLIRRHGPWASAWVGESGGAYNSGGRHVSDTFVNSFWYLDQLGMASKYHTKVYCRQTLIGGNYGLLNATTYVPNPDYYSALLWHRLMGKVVLAVDGDVSPFLRSYAHCSKGRAGVTLLVINLSNQTNFIMNVQNSINLKLTVKEQSISRDSFKHSLKKTFSWVGVKASDEALFREEYHLTPKDGYLQSRTMVLNGIPLELTGTGNIPRLDPVHVNVKSPISISPLSFAFIVFPNFQAPACG
ncbi:heparanase-like protein 1 [Durio zibethinus]|uniref:Heparanase-like protein 1 n=1 Tax=Durio zibethinus TaxID=66656 RepID=A0A6P5XJW3_DURZI|nr:heparanase-like protein 1 [Durio zibethinus]XP_022728468.1 heparanase-like protein 1 [Durio zibethinus]XP_022728476.1 heparanase-like protein 1 [Durio zibethinus]XP_022728481.1 heparanase-like protein 1 [Durio zibethinus]